MERFARNRKEYIAFTFDEWELELIAKLLTKHLPTYDKGIEKINNHPKNEGQATYQYQLDQLIAEKKAVMEMIEYLPFRHP